MVGLEGNATAAGRLPDTRLVALGRHFHRHQRLRFRDWGRSHRIAAQIVTGIGFLGAGAIIHYGGTVRA